LELPDDIEQALTSRNSEAELADAKARDEYPTELEDKVERYEQQRAEWARLTATPAAFAELAEALTKETGLFEDEAGRAEFVSLMGWHMQDMATPEAEVAALEEQAAEVKQDEKAQIIEAIAKYDAQKAAEEEALKAAIEKTLVSKS